MERIRIYFKPIWYNIVRHKALPGFCRCAGFLPVAMCELLIVVASAVANQGI